MYELKVRKSSKVLTVLVDGSDEKESIYLLGSHPDFQNCDVLTCRQVMTNSSLYVVGERAPKVQVEFNTHPYEFAHGHGPRGRGGWMFEFRRNEFLTLANGSTSFNGTYAEAKKAARARVQELAAAGKAVPAYVELAVCS